MISSRGFCFFCLFSGFAFPAEPVLQDDPKVDAEKMAKALEAIENKQDLEEQNGFSSFEQDLTSAVVSEEEAVKFYENCARKVEIEGKKLDSKEWTDWKNKNQAMLSDKNFQNWLQLQLRYLQLWTKAYKKTELGQLEDPLIALAMEVRNSILTFEKEKAEKKIPDYRANSIQVGVSQSYFAKAYRLESLIKETKGWDINIANSDQILESVLMQGFRSMNSPRLFEVWEKRFEWVDLKEKYVVLSTEQKRDLENEVLNQQWKMVQDFKAYGLQNKAVNLMFSIVTKAPDHPQFDAWSKELKSTLGSLSPVSTNPTTTPTSTSTSDLAPKTPHSHSNE